MLPRRRTARQSKRFTEKRNKRALIVVGAGLALIVLLTYSVSFVSKMDFLTIRSVSVSGVDLNQISSLEDRARLLLAGSYAGLISRSNVFTYPRSGIAKAVAEAYPAADTVEVSRSGRTLLVGISEKNPAALACAGLPDFSGGNDNCYFADGTGRIFKSAASSTPGMYRKYFVPDLSGQYVASTTRFAELQTSYERLTSAGIEVEGILIGDKGEYEIYVHDPFDTVSSQADRRLIVIYADDRRSLSEEVVNLISFWNNMIDASRLSSQKPSIQSIDVRYGSNVFYRLE